MSVISFIIDSSDYDECKPNPCQNGGTCQDEIAGYTCKCKPGTKGKNCELSMH